VRYTPHHIGFWLALAVASTAMCSAAEPPLRLATFEVDATPPLGTPISYAPAKDVMDPLSCRGIVLLGDKLPIVLCAVDWISVRNGTHDAFRMALAEAAQTAPDRVAMHCLHQHDAPGYDFDSELLLAGHGEGFPADFARDTIRRAADAVRTAIPDAKPVTHIGTGLGKVEQVASNRRVLGPDGRVAHVRWSSTKDAAARAAPEGVIDPFVRLICFYDGDQPLAGLTYYATHPQSYYTRGSISIDFVGMARQMRERETKVFHLHFNGAAGNITAGKYNDGDPANRPILAKRLADGMAAAWEAKSRAPIGGSQVDWRVVWAALPPAPSPSEESLVAQLKKDPAGGGDRALAWLRRANNGHQIPLTCLTLGKIRVLHMPGELFIEYQLVAQQMRPELFVAMAAYGDGGPGYIGTRLAYSQGGYEVGSPSKVAPDVEDVLTSAMQTLLEVSSPPAVTPSDITRTYPRLPAVSN
jgi:hypothetical protein